MSSTFSNSTSPAASAIPTLTPQPPILPPIPDAWVLLALPIVTYWILSLFFHYLDTHNLLARYRLHTPAEVLKRNHVTRAEVVRDVILQQVIQTIVGGVTAMFEGVKMVGNEPAEVMALYEKIEAGVRGLGVIGINGPVLVGKLARALEESGGDKALLRVFAHLGLDTAEWKFGAVEFAYWYIAPVLRLGVAIFILDTWQYFLHRGMHESKWLYKTFHSRHHRLYVPYAFGALYNHPFEGLLMDTIGAGLGYKLSGMGTRGAMVFFGFSTMKTVDDHCGYSLPWDPLQKMFWNNAGYHDIHHQSWGIKTNYSQPFLICWDRWLSTQWVGGDVTARYAESRERAAAAMENDRLAAAGTSKLHVEPPLPRMNGTNGHAANGHANGHANGGANGNGVTTNGAMKAANGINGNGAANGLKNGWAEGMGSEPEEREVEINGPRRSSRRRKTRVAS